MENSIRQCLELKKMFVLLNDIVSTSKHANYVLLSNQKCTPKPNLLLLIYILMNTVKNYTIIYLQLN